MRNFFQHSTCGDQFNLINPINSINSFNTSQSPKPPVPPIIFLERGVKLRLAKIRPERRRDEQLGVRNLPEQEIADAHLAAGAYQQVRIREASSVKVLGEYLFGDVGGIHFA